MRSPHTTTESSPSSAATRESPRAATKDPTQPKRKKKKNLLTSPRGRIALPGFVAQLFLGIITVNSLDGKAQELLDLDNNGKARR